MTADDRSRIYLPLNEDETYLLIGRVAVFTAQIEAVLHVLVNWSVGETAAGEAVSQDLHLGPLAKLVGRMARIGKFGSSSTEVGDCIRLIVDGDDKEASIADRRNLYIHARWGMNPDYPDKIGIAKVQRVVKGGFGVMVPYDREALDTLGRDADDVVKRLADVTMGLAPGGTN